MIAASQVPTRPQGDDHRSGFTLIELLAVFAVIAILVGILIPILGKARLQAESVACVSNLRGIGQGIHLFATEHNGELPPGASVDEVTNWYHLLEPYVGQFVSDPESEERLKWQHCPSKDFSIKERRHIGYGWNYQNFGSSINSPDHGWRTRLTEVEEPSNTIIVGDSADLEIADGNPWMNIYIYDHRFPERHARRHKDGGNYLMVDGSVVFFSADDLFEALPEIYKVKK